MIVNHLKTVIAIANVGSFSIASKILYVSQPYLTKIVKKIEDAYDLKIFKRNKKGVELTSEGKEFVDRAKVLLKHVDDLNNVKKNDHKKKEIIELTISAFPSSYPIEAYIDFYKKIEKSKTLSRCQYYEKNAIEVLDDINLQFSDIGIISIKNMFFKQNSLYFLQKGIEYKRIFELEPTLILRKKHPLLKKKKITLNDLYKYNLVTFENSHNLHTAIFDEGYYNQKNLSHIIKFEKFKHITYVNTRGTMHSILINSNKIAIGNYIPTVNHKLFDLYFIPLKNIIKDVKLEEIANTLYCIYLKSKPLSKYAKLYLDILEKTYKKHL